MNRDELQTILDLHKEWLSAGGDGKRADLQWADLRWANLRGADLQGADLQGADLDFSAWPLWCGSLDVKIDKKLFAQLAYHLCRTVVDDAECIAAQNALLPIANQFHRVEECGLIKRNACES